MKNVCGETEDLRREMEKLRGELAEIHQSRAWRAFCAYNAARDFLLGPLKRSRLVRKLAYWMGFRSRSKPIAAKASRVKEIEALFRRDERRPIVLSELPAKSLGSMRVAVHLHLFYLEMASFFIERLSHIPVPFDLYISVTADGGETAARFAEIKNAASVTMEVVENRGRDVRPMIRTFGEKLAGYDVFLHIHSKKSPHSGALAGWLDFLADNLLSKHTPRILGLFAGHPELGILYPEPWDAFPYWTLTNGANREEMERLFAMLGMAFPAEEKYADFPVGTMFWARGAALAPLLTAPVEGFPDEEGQVDGTLAHAVERSLCLVAAAAGYKPAQINAAKDRVAIGPGLKNLPEYISIDRKKALLYLRGFKHVTFDLFGTLVMPDGRARTGVVDLLNSLRKAEVVVAEDTDLSGDAVREILKQCGVTREAGVCLSSETGFTKKDGSLYDHLKNRFKGQPFVNVGDDEAADAHIPNTRRIHQLHVMHPGDMAAVIGLSGAEKERYDDRMTADPFCLLDVLREKATAPPAAQGGQAP